MNCVPLVTPMVLNVWVQLYLGEEKHGRVFRVRMMEDAMIEDLKEEVNLYSRGELQSPMYRWLVYKADADNALDERDELKSYWLVGDKPLRVVVPATGKNKRMCCTDHISRYS
jgi:hypothetical protein